MRIDDLVSKFVSEGIIYLIVFGIMLFVGFYVVPDVESTWYPILGSVGIGQLLIGVLLSESGRIQPTESERVESGRIDLVWGVKRFWKNLFWPLYLNGKAL